MDNVNQADPQSPHSPVVSCRQVSKTFSEGGLVVEVLQDIDFDVAVGQQVAIIGASGSGKSTLLHILGSLSDPSTGKVFIDGIDVGTLSEKKKGDLRNHALGFVYQFHHLLPEFSALENVAMPLLIRKEDDSEAFDRARDVLHRVGLGERLRHKPGELSGGERQRAAIARAVVTRPRCIMADEPTGNLDARTAAAVHELLLELNQEYHTSLITVTHDLALAERIGYIVTLEDGRLLPD